MTDTNRMISRRKFLSLRRASERGSHRRTIVNQSGKGAVNIRYFWRAPWPSSDVYANWLIDEWNKKNGDRIRVNGASVDGETYKTKQTIEMKLRQPARCVLLVGRRSSQRIN